ncbi:MAG: hypothetical protein OEL20_16785 [Sulfuritalea sp.]|nr:hypothetical protein [Sulfuritalea sp.]
MQVNIDLPMGDQMPLIEHTTESSSSDDRGLEQAIVRISGDMVDATDQDGRAGFLLRVEAHCYTEGPDYRLSKFDEAIEWFISESEGGDIVFEIADRLADPLTRFGMCVGPHLCKQVYDAAVVAYRETINKENKWYAFGNSLKQQLPEVGTSIAWRLLKCSRKLIPLL